MADSAAHNGDSLAALEAFVTENDELLELEERIGKFNVFDALRIARAEIRHSNFLAWLLDPAESHGQGDLFLKAVLMDLLRQAPAKLRPLSPVELDGDELRGVEIRREWKNIDLLIRCEQPAFVVVIENKVDSGEHSNQLSRYAEIVREQFEGVAPMFVFLTPDADEPSEQGWTPYSYADIHRVLQRVRRTNAASIGGDVAVFLEHYLRLIGSRFMNDEKIDELCQRIYKNHRQALELIFERVGAASSGTINAIESVLAEQPDRWHVVNRRSEDIEFVPASWVGELPLIGARPKFDPGFWVVLGFGVRKRGLRLLGKVWPTTDPCARQRVLDRLVKDPDEFGFRLFFKNKEASERWTTIRNGFVLRWNEDDGPDEEACSLACRKTLDQLYATLADVPRVIREALKIEHAAETARIRPTASSRSAADH